MNKEINLPVWQHVSLIVITSLSIHHLWNFMSRPSHSTKVVVKRAKGGKSSEGKAVAVKNKGNKGSKGNKETLKGVERVQPVADVKPAVKPAEIIKVENKGDSLTDAGEREVEGEGGGDSDGSSEYSESYDSEIEELEEGEIKDYTFPLEAFKMVLCVNTSLKKMDKGKAMAQCGHATLGAYRISDKYAPSNVKHWLRIGQTKIAVKCTEEEMVQVAENAKRLGVVSYTVEDAGRTQIPAGSKTVCALGPAPQSVLDEITGGFKLM